MSLGASPRILFVDSVYSSFLSSSGLDRKPAPDDSYATLLSEAMGQAFGTSDAMSAALSTFGWTADDVVSNSRTLQALWAREHARLFVLPAGWKRGWRIVTHRAIRSWSWHLPHIQGLVQARIEHDRPDVLYVHDLELLGHQQLAAIKRHVRLLVGQSGVGLPDAAILRHYDLIVSSLPSNVSTAQALGVPSILLPQAFDDRVLGIEPPPVRDIDVSFVGSFSRRHSTTENLLRTVGEACPTLQIYGVVDEKILKKTGLERFYAGPAWGKDMYRIMRRSKIALNRHIDLAGPYAVNMRLFEATGCGALLLTEDRFNLVDYFAPGKEVVTYTTSQDAAEQAAALLSEQTRLNAIASAGRVRTLRDHTYSARMEDLSEVLLSLLDCPKSR